MNLRWLVKVSGEKVLQQNVYSPHKDLWEDIATYEEPKAAREFWIYNDGKYMPTIAFQRPPDYREAFWLHVREVLSNE